MSKQVAGSWQSSEERQNAKDTNLARVRAINLIDANGASKKDTWQSHAERTLTMRSKSKVPMRFIQTNLSHYAAGHDL